MAAYAIGAGARPTIEPAASVAAVSAFGSSRSLTPSVLLPVPVSIASAPAIRSSEPSRIAAFSTARSPPEAAAAAGSEPRSARSDT